MPASNFAAAVLEAIVGAAPGARPLLIPAASRLGAAHGFRVILVATACRSLAAVGAISVPTAVAAHAALAFAAYAYGTRGHINDRAPDTGSLQADIFRARIHVIAIPVRCTLSFRNDIFDRIVIRCNVFLVVFIILVPVITVFFCIKIVSSVCCLIGSFIDILPGIACVGSLKLSPVQVKNARAYDEHVEDEDHGS